MRTFWKGHIFFLFFIKGGSSFPNFFVFFLFHLFTFISSYWYSRLLYSAKVVLFCVLSILSYRQVCYHRPIWRIHQNIIYCAIIYFDYYVMENIIYFFTREDMQNKDILKMPYIVFVFYQRRQLPLNSLIVSRSNQMCWFSDQSVSCCKERLL